MKTVKIIVENLDLYGFDILLDFLKSKFTFVSFAPNSIPTVGSKTITVEKLKAFKQDTKIEKVINHKNGDVTLITNFAYCKFIK